MFEKSVSILGSDHMQRIHQMHRDMAFTYPDDVERLGSSPICNVQGMYRPHHLLCLQGHPEFNAKIMAEILETRHQTGVFDDKAYKKFVQKLELPHDGLTVGNAFIRFLLDE